MEQPEIDGCYLCEIGTDGLIVPFHGREIMVCAKCALEAIHNHPKLVRLKQALEKTSVN